MLTLPTNPELESRLAVEATKRGLEPGDFVMLVLEDFMTSAVGSEAEDARLAAINELMGIGVNSGFNTDDLHAEREHERDAEESSFLARFDSPRTI